MRQTNQTDLHHISEGKKEDQVDTSQCNTTFQIDRVLRSHEECRKSYDSMSSYYDLWSSWEKPFQTKAINMLAVQSGHRVLEVGIGTGANLVPLAMAAGPTGALIGIDLSSKMIQKAAERSQSHQMKTVVCGGSLIEVFGRTSTPDTENNKEAAVVQLIVGDAINLTKLIQELKSETASENRPTFPELDNDPTKHQKDSEQGPMLFDRILLCFTLELFDTDEIPQVLCQCQECLKKGGEIVVCGLSKLAKEGIMMKLYSWGHRTLPNIVDCRPIYVQASLESVGYIVKEVLQIPMYGLMVECVKATHQ